MGRGRGGTAVVIVLPFLVSQFRAVQLATVAAYFIAIVGLDILTGTSGQISLGHGALMAIGGYATGILMVDHGVRDLWTIPAAGVVGFGVGIVVGIPALRLRGLYLALATFGIAVALPTILKRFEGLTGGSTGLSLFSQLTGHGVGVTIGGHALTNNDWLYALCWSIAIPLYLVAWWLLSSKFGRSLTAIRDNELAAAASGINRSTYKVLAFGVSSAYAGVAGALYAIIATFVSPDTFPITLSLYLLVGAVVGVYGSIWGALLGALLIQFLPDLVDLVPAVDAKSGGPRTFFFGAILVGVMILLPLLSRLTNRLYSRS